MFKEGCIIVQLTSHHELGLEVFPDLMMFLGLDTLLKNDGVLQVLIKLGRVFPELSQLVYLDIAREVHTFLGDLEHLILLVVIDKIIVA